MLTESAEFPLLRNTTPHCEGPSQVYPVSTCLGLGSASVLGLLCRQPLDHNSASGEKTLETSPSTARWKEGVSIHTLTQHTLYPLCAGHGPRSLGYTSKSNQDPCSQGTYCVMRRARQRTPQMNKVLGTLDGERHSGDKGERTAG